MFYFWPRKDFFEYFLTEAVPQDGKVTRGLHASEKKPFEHTAADDDGKYEDCWSSRSTSLKCCGFSGKIPAVNFVKIHSENIAVSDTASLY